jgi:hypothetical protein
VGWHPTSGNKISELNWFVGCFFKRTDKRSSTITVKLGSKNTQEAMKKKRRNRVGVHPWRSTKIAKRTTSSGLSSVP